MTHVMDHLAMMAVGTGLGLHVMDEQQGRMRRYILCHGCGALSASPEVFASVQVPIKGCRSIGGALARMTSPEVLDGSNQYSCSACRSKQDASLGRYFDGELTSRLPKPPARRLAAPAADAAPRPRLCCPTRPPADHLPPPAGAALPLVLTMQLVRFDFDPMTMRRKKLTDEVQVPAVVDLAPFLRPPEAVSQQAAAAGSPGAFASADEAAEAALAGSGAQYELFAVMMHTGGAYGGHYFAYVKDLLLADAAAGPRWVCFNDSHVTEMSAPQLRRAFGGTRAEPWDPEAAAVRAEAAEPLAPSAAGSEEAFEPPAAGAESGAGAAAEAGGSPATAAAKAADASAGTAPVTASKAPVAGASANAYMLVYRRRDPSRPPPPVSPDDAPAGMLEEVRADNAAFAGLREEWEWHQQLLSLKVHHLPAGGAVTAEAAAAAGAPGTAAASSAGVDIHQSKTVDDATLLAAAALGLMDPALAPDPGTERDPGAAAKPDPKPDGGAAPSAFQLPSREACLSRCRLRHFDSLKAVMLAPLEKLARGPGQPAPALVALDDPPRPHRPLVLELRPDGSAPWPSWTDGAAVIKVLLFASSETGGTFASPVQVTVSEGSLAALRAAVEDRLMLHGRCRLVAMRGEKAAVLAAEDEAAVSLRHDLKLSTGDTVYVDPVTEGESEVVRLLEGVANSVTVTFEPLRPLEPEDVALLVAEGAMATHEGVSGEAVDTDARCVTIDQRESLASLRAAVEAATGATPGTLRILKPPKGPELKDDARPLSFYGLIGGGKVVLRRGKPLEPSQFSLRVLLHRPTPLDGAALDSAAAGPSSGPARPARPARPGARPAAASRPGPGARPGPRGPAGGPRPGPRGGPRGPAGAGRPRPAAPGGPGGAASKFVSLGEVATTADTPVAALKELIARRCGGRAGQALVASRMRLRERTGNTLAGSLLDCRTVGDAVTGQLADGKPVVVQVLDADEFLREGDILLGLRRWLPDEGRLQPRQPEWAVGPKTTFGELRDLAARRSGLPREALVLGKASAFALRDPKAIANIPYFGQREGAAPAEAAGFLGRQQPPDDASLTQGPWKLRSGTTVLFKDGRVGEALRTAEDGDAADPAGAHAVRSRPEAAFRIFTPQEQRERAEQRGREAEERKARADAAAKEASADEGRVRAAAARGDVDLRKYAILMKSGVPESAVRLSMAKDDVDVELFLPRVVDLVARMLAEEVDEG